MKFHEYQITATSLLPAVAIALAAGIFIADTITESEIAFPVFYTAIVLIAARFCTKRGIIIVGMGCIGLILLSDVLTIDVSPSQAGIANTAISVVAIAATTYLAAKIQTERETAYQVRSQLAHVMRVTTLGEMATSIAHQINQPLAAMAVHSNACLNWLDAEPPNLDEARKNISRIAKDADRANEIIVQVRNLTKGSPSEKTWLQINEVIHSTVGFLDREIQEQQISLQTELADNVPAVQGDRVQLQQVVLNLMLNAIEAVNQASLGQRRLVISSTQRDPKNVLITVQDTGTGFAPEDSDRLFDAFFTTKRNGMGMGLAISRSIVESHGGRIWATSYNPAGAAFHFTLPVGSNVHA
jgi:Signal transduction histidine kinase regulating C4-dicarboxylate transport system